MDIVIPLQQLCLLKCISIANTLEIGRINLRFEFENVNELIYMKPINPYLMINTISNIVLYLYNIHEIVHRRNIP